MTGHVSYAFGELGRELVSYQMVCTRTQKKKNVRDKLLGYCSFLRIQFLYTLQAEYFKGKIQKKKKKKNKKRKSKILEKRNQKVKETKI